MDVAMKQLFIVLIGISVAFAGNFEKRECSKDSLRADYKISYGGLGAGYSDLDKINVQMQKNGFDRMDQGVVLITGGEQYHYKQLILAGESTVYLWRITDNDTRRHFQGAIDATALAGFDLIGNERYTLFPFLGVGVGSIVHHMSYEDLPFDAVSTGTDKSDETIWQPAVLLKTGVGFDLEIPGKKEQGTVGVRAGYTFDIGDGDRWYRDLSTIAGAPSYKLSGPFFKLVFGIKSTGENSRMAR